jgi:acyl-CoA thioesterase
LPDHPFDADTRLRATARGEYEATITDRWSALGGVPNGGYLLALCLHALKWDSPLPDPLVASATYLRPPVAGPAEIRTEAVRAGRRVATAQARLLQDGVEAVRVLASFADLGRDADLVALAMLVDAAAPAVLELGETGSATIQLTVHLRAHPAPGWLACRSATRHVAGGYHEEDFEIWDSRGVLVAQSRQLAVLRT